MKQKPSHQWYTQDFLSSSDVQMMSAEEVGCYCLLLFNCYVNGGKIPDDPTGLSMLCRGITPTEKVMKKFYKKNNTLRHKRVDTEIQKAENFSKVQRENAKKRWNKAQNVTEPSQSHGIDSASNRQSPRGVCSSSSSSSLNKKEIKVIKKEKEIEKNTGAEEIVTTVQTAFGLPILDGTDKQNNAAATRLLQKFPPELIQATCQLAAADGFWSTKITSITALEKHFMQLASLSRKSKGYTII